MVNEYITKSIRSGYLYLKFQAQLKRFAHYYVRKNIVLELWFLVNWIMQMLFSKTHGSIFKTRYRECRMLLLFLFISFFYLRCTGQHGKGEGISLTPLYHFHPLYRHLHISWVITAQSSPLHIASSQARPKNLWFSRAS